jgi:hypothetical protein
MSNLTGLIKDPASNTVSGELTLTLNSPLIRDAITPKSLVLPIVKKFTITNGVVDVDLEESETDGTTYTFDFKVLSGGVLAEESLDPFPFTAQIPNAAEVDLIDLIPTGVVNAVLDTSSRRIARTIATTPELAALIGGLSPKGDWSNNTQYKYNDLVKYNGKLYICQSLTPVIGVIPSALSIAWMDITPESDGSLMVGDGAAYGAAWELSELAPSKSVLFGVLEQKAPIANPTLTGDVVVPTLATSDTSTKAANAVFVNNKLAAYAPLANPALTGTPTAPTATSGTSSLQIANTAFSQTLCRPAVFTDVGSTLSQTASFLVLTYSTETFDTNNAFSGNTFTAPFTGYYFVSGAISIANLDSNARQFSVNIMLSGSAYRAVSSIILQPGQGSALILAGTIVPMITGQTLQIRVDVFGGASIPFSIFAGGSTHLSIFRLPL